MAPELPRETEEAQQLLAQLTGDLLRCKRRERDLSRAAGKLQAHHHDHAEKLLAAVRAPRGSALEDAAFEHLNEARAARALQ